MRLFNISEKKDEERLKQADILTDLDRLVEKEACIIVNGKPHYLSPITTEVFFQFVTKLAKLKELEDADEIRQAYVELIQTVISSLSEKEIYKLTQVQCGVLVQIVLDKIMGKPVKKEPGESDQKKK